MTKVPEILVVGSFVMDMITSTKNFPSEGETVRGCGFSMAPGGKGANQAVQAARLGARVTMVGKVGNDAFGRRLIAASSEAGINIKDVKLDETAPSAVGNVIVEDRDNSAYNRIIVVPGANMTICPKDVSFLRENIGIYDMVILQLEIPMEINILVSGYAKEKGVPVMLNAAPYDVLPRELLANITYISPNEHEAAALTGLPVERDGVVDLELVKAAAARLLEMGAEHALITLGDKGAAFSDKDGFILCPAKNGVTAVDPTAAGDSFVAAFCTAVCCGADYRLAVEFANDVAATTVSRLGAQPSLPTIKEVMAGWDEERQTKFHSLGFSSQEVRTA